MSESSQNLLNAARNGDIQDFEALLGSDPSAEILNAKDEYSKSTVLHMAAANGHLELVQRVLNILGKEDAKSLVRSKNESGNTPLHWACLTGNLDCCKLLVEAGAEILAKNMSKIDSVIQAENSGHMEIMDYLLDKLGVEVPEDSLADLEGPDAEEEEEEEPKSEGTNAGTNAGTTNPESA